MLPVTSASIPDLIGAHSDKSTACLLRRLVVSVHKAARPLRYQMAPASTKPLLPAMYYILSPEPKTVLLILSLTKTILIITPSAFVCSLQIYKGEGNQSMGSLRVTDTIKTLVILFCGTYYKSGTVSNTLHLLALLILSTTQWREYFLLSPFYL